MRPRSPLPVHAYFVLGATAQYVGAGLAVLLFEYVDPVGVTLLRVGGAAVMLCAWRRPRLGSFDRGVRRQAVIFGVITTAMNLSFYLAAASLPLGNAVAIEFLGPIAVAVAGSRSRRNVVALVLAVGGVGLLADVEMAAHPTGVLWALAAALLWAGYIIYGKRVADVEGGGLDGLSVGLAAGALLLAPAAMPALIDQGGRWELILIAGMAVALLSSVVPYVLDQVVLPRLSQAHFAFLLALLPVTASVVGAVMLGQLPMPIEAFAIAMVVFAVTIRSDQN